MTRIAAAVLLASLLSCNGKEPDEPPVPPRPVVAGAPMAGVAEGFLELPIGTPLGGFTSRCGCLGNQSKVDDRQSAYNVAFVESAGVHMLPSLDVIWLENGDDTLVLVKTDTIYPFDQLVTVVAERLSAETGVDLTNKVVHTTNHSHHSYGAFSDQEGFYLGTDKYNEEIFQRFVQQVVDTSLRARAAVEPVELGMGWFRDWDATDQVYRDRRGDNADLVVLDPQGTPIPTGKDPDLGVLRIDTLDHRPLAMVVNFGMHGIILDITNPLVSSDAGGGVETALEETFDEPVMVMFTQAGGGDASPGGRQDGYAAVESVGELAAPLIRPLYDQVQTSAQPIRLETFAWNIPQDRAAVHIDRNGTVAYSYEPYREGGIDDGVVYEADGTLSMPIDEFNTLNGAAFCGTGDLDLPVGGLTTATYPYTNCMEVSFLSTLIEVFFKMEPDSFPLPVPHLARASAAASRIGPLRTLRHDGTTGDDDQIIGFIPGEPTAMYTEMFKRRVAQEAGFEHAMIIGYSMDEEGYQMLPEDWLRGGYEPDISIWGPLAAEHVQETLIEGIGEILGSDVHEDPDPLGLYGPTSYAVKPLPTLAPDETPGAGTRLDVPFEGLFFPGEVTPDLVVPATVPRVQGLVQLAWQGGDPGVDLPVVTIQRLVDGTWTTLTTHAGREIRTGMPDILLGHTPDPLYPVEAAQTHWYTALWQPVGHVLDRTGLPTGTYRLHVEGQRYTGGATTWPWPSESYTLDSAEFEVVPAAITIEPAPGGAYVSIRGRADGFRMVHLDGDYRGDNPVIGPVDLVVGGVELSGASVTTDGARSFIADPALETATSITVTDAYGNTGVWP